MRRVLVASVSGLSLALRCTAVGAQQMAKSGSISFHTGWRDIAEATQVADKQILGQGRDVGVTFNDMGSGPLQLGPAICAYSFFLTDGTGPVKGYCAFGDADSDRIYTDFTGTIGSDGANGTNVISGGTGKWAGVSGSGPWKCKAAGPNGEFQCAQRLDYRLP